MLLYINSLPVIDIDSADGPAVIITIMATFAITSYNNSIRYGQQVCVKYSHSASTNQKNLEE